MYFKFLCVVVSIHASFDRISEPGNRLRDTDLKKLGFAFRSPKRGQERSYPTTRERDSRRRVAEGPSHLTRATFLLPENQGCVKMVVKGRVASQTPPKRVESKRVNQRLYVSCTCSSFLSCLPLHDAFRASRPTARPDVLLRLQARCHPICNQNERKSKCEMCAWSWWAMVSFIVLVFGCFLILAWFRRGRREEHHRHVVNQGNFYAPCSSQQSVRSMITAEFRNRSNILSQK